MHFLGGLRRQFEQRNSKCNCRVATELVARDHHTRDQNTLTRARNAIIPTAWKINPMPSIPLLHRQAEPQTLATFNPDGPKTCASLGKLYPKKPSSSTVDSHLLATTHLWAKIQFLTCAWECLGQTIPWEKEAHPPPVCLGGLVVNKCCAML